MVRSEEANIDLYLASRGGRYRLLMALPPTMAYNAGTTSYTYNRIEN